MAAHSRPPVPLALALLLVVCGCGGSDDGDGGGGTAQLSGLAFKGTLAGATVALHRLSPTGASGRFISSGSTDAEGRFSLGVSNFRGWFLVKATGGLYVDEATGDERTVPVEYPLYGMAEVTGGGPVEVLVTPTTTIAFRILQALGAQPTSDTGILVANAGVILERFLGLSGIYTTPPADLTAGPVVPGDAADQGIVVSGISQLAASLGIEAPEMAHRLADDFLDYVGDGSRFQTTIVLSNNDALPADAATAGFADAIDAFLAGPRNRSGLAGGDTAVDDTLRGNTTGDLARPIQVLATEGMYGDATAPRSATITARNLPPVQTGGPAVLVFAGDQQLNASVTGPDRIDVIVRDDLATRQSDLTIIDATTGLVTLVEDGLASGSSALAPEIDRWGPARGPVAGGTLLEITGWNLYGTTEVLLGGTPAQVAYARPPGLLAVYTPASAPASVTLTVRNGASGTTAPATFRYDTGDIRSSAPQPDPGAALSIASLRVFLDGNDGLSAITSLAGTTWFNADSGTFTSRERIVSAAAPQADGRNRQGDTQRSLEPLRWSIRFDDTSNGIEDFYRLDVAQRTPVLGGVVNEGIAIAWTTPGGMRIDTITGTYWASGWIVNPGAGTIREVVGWFAFGSDERGSANLQFVEQPFGGGSGSGSPFFDGFRFGFGFGFQPDGTYVATLSDAENEALQFDGAFDATGSLGYFTGKSDKDAVCFYTLTRIEPGGGVRSVGPWTAGTMRAEGGGFVYGLQATQLSPESGSTGQALSFWTGTRTDPDNLAGAVEDATTAERWTIDPTGTARDATGMRRGLLNADLGLGAALGRFPDIDGSGGLDDVRFETGTILHPFSRFTHESMAAEYWLVRQQYAWPDAAQDPADPVSAGARSVSRMTRSTFDAGRPPTLLARPFVLAGTLPSLESDTPAGFQKTVARDALTGDVSVETGAPDALLAEVGVTYIDDTGYLFATRTTGAGSPLAGSDFPLALDSGTLASDAEFWSGHALASAAPGSLLLLVEVIDPPRPVPVDNRPCVELTWEFDTGASPAPLSYLTKAGQVFFALNQSSIQLTAGWSVTRDDGSVSNGAQSVSGTASIDPQGFLRLEMPSRDGAATLVYRGVTTPAQDFIVLLDDTRVDRPERAGVLAMVRRRFSAGALNRNWRIQSQSLAFASATGAPAAASTSNGELTFLPSVQTRNLIGSGLKRLNHPVVLAGNTRSTLVVRDGIFRQTLVSPNGAGAASAQFVGETRSLELFFSDLGRTICYVNEFTRFAPALFVGHQD